MACPSFDTSGSCILIRATGFKKCCLGIMCYLLFISFSYKTYGTVLRGSRQVRYKIERRRPTCRRPPIISAPIPLEADLIQRPDLLDKLDDRLFELRSPSFAETHSRCALPSSPGRFRAQHVAHPRLGVDIAVDVVAAPLVAGGS